MPQAPTTGFTPLVLVPPLVAFATALVLTPVVRAFARSIGLIAAPSKDRWHQQPTALLGGIAVFAAFVAGLATELGLMRGTSNLRLEWVGIVVAATLMFLVGLVDDKAKIRPATKMIFQAAAAAIMISAGVVYPVTPWHTLNVLATFFWFLALTNALNLLDNMDGVAAGVAGIAAISLAAAFAWDRAWAPAGVCLVLAGAAAGFLPYNFSRASIFMGDSGSLFLGSLLAGLGAAYPHSAPVSIVAVLFIPAAVVILPILDTTLVTVGRMLAGRPISVGGRDHTSHRLVALGLGEREVALLMYGVSALAGAMALMLRGAPSRVALPAGAILLAILLVFTAYLGRMHTYAPTVRPRGPVTLLVSNLFHKRRAFEMVLDLILFAAAYQIAFLLRWDGAPPPDRVFAFDRTLALAVIAQSVAYGLVGVYRGTWQQLSIADVHRLIRATVAGTLLTVFLTRVGAPAGEIPASVFVLDGLLVGLLASGARAAFQSLQLLRLRLDVRGTPALLYGAGEAAELLVREIVSNPELRLRPVGFIDDDPDKRDRLVHGIRVVGTGKDLPALIARHRVGVIVLCSRKIPDERASELRRQCETLGVELSQFRVGIVPTAGTRSEPLRAGA